MTGSGGQCWGQHGQDLSLAARLRAVGRGGGVGRADDIVNGERRSARSAGVRLERRQRRAELGVKGLSQIGRKKGGQGMRHGEYGGRCWQGAGGVRERERTARVVRVIRVVSCVEVLQLKSIIVSIRAVSKPG